MPPNPLPPKALLFDVFGTVMDWRTSLTGDLAAFGAARGITADWTRLVDAWRAAYQPTLDRVRNGELPWTKLDDLHRTTLDRLVAEHGIAGLNEADLAHINRFWHRLRPWPDVPGALARLKTRFIIAPLSNGNVGLLTRMARHAGLPWDAILGADLFWHYKPDPQVYLGACDLLNLAPEEAMMVAAHNSDLRAARALGLRTGFFPRPTEYGPGQTANLAAEEAWDVVARDALDLADQLGA